MKIKKVAVCAGSAACGLIVVLACIFFILNSAPSGAFQKERNFSVRSGEGAAVLAERLKEEGLIRSKTFFKILCSLRGLQYSLQKGDYRAESKISSWRLISMMTSGCQVAAMTVIPEGYTLKQIADTLVSQNVIADKNRFVDEVNQFSLKDYGIDKIGAEGFLFPDTYSFQAEMDDSEVIHAMVSNFFDHIEESRFPIDELFYDRVILASVVEKEYQVEEEAAFIASVFLNRIKKKMRLESCATVLYIITDIQGKPHPKQLFYSDLEIDSPYNTYRRYGLPPAPISNPGIVSLKAVFHPAETDYLFFVVKGDGSGRHTFSKDFYTHNYYKRHQ